MYYTANRLYKCNVNHINKRCTVFCIDTKQSEIQRSFGCSRTGLNRCRYGSVRVIITGSTCWNLEHMTENTHNQLITVGCCTLTFRICFHDKKGIGK